MSLIIRRAKSEDLLAIGALAGQLVRQHHDFDERRFMLIPQVETGYARFFAGQLASEQTLIVVAEEERHIVGYAYARLEERDWNALLDAHGALHDIFVTREARRRGIARQLLEAVREWMQGKRARFVLHTASKNHEARQFFAALGFRETMIELTSELPR